MATPVTSPGNRLATKPPIPRARQSIFHHLFWDIAWMGLLQWAYFSRLGALGGSYLAATIGLTPALFVAFWLRLFAAYAVWQWR